MDQLWTLCRFLGSVASYYITPTPPDFEITRAEANGTDVTPQLLSWMAMQRPDYNVPWEESDTLVVEYRYKGAGPFIIYFDKGEEFAFPPGDAALPKPLEYCLVSVEVEREGKEESIDISERGFLFAGPSGRWDDRLPPRDGLPNDRTRKLLDLKLLYPDIREGDLVIISFANGDEIQLSA